MSIVNAFLVSTLAGMSTLLGGIIIFFKIKENKINQFITFCLAFSISIMIGISVTDLIPTSFFDIFLNFNFPLSLFIFIISLTIGILIVLFADKILNFNSNKTLYQLGILNMIALILHNFPEGIATFIGSIQDSSLGIKLGIAIMLHNIPEGISIAVPIYYATGSKKKALYNTFLSGIAEPLGALLACIFLKKYITNLMISIILLLVAGIMITLSIHEMLPKALGYKKNKFIYLGFIMGIILNIINILINTH